MIPTKRVLEVKITARIEVNDDRVVAGKVHDAIREFIDSTPMSASGITGRHRFADGDYVDLKCEFTNKYYTSDGCEIVLNDA